MCMCACVYICGHIQARTRRVSAIGRVSAVTHKASHKFYLVNAQAIHFVLAHKFNGVLCCAVLCRAVLVDCVSLWALHSLVRMYLCYESTHIQKTFIEMKNEANTWRSLPKTHLSCPKRSLLYHDMRSTHNQTNRMNEQTNELDFIRHIEGRTRARNMYVCV